MNTLISTKLEPPALLFPTLVTAQEFLLYNELILGSNGSWAYTQASNPVLLQLVSITGLWGLTFLTTWFAATFNWAWERDFSWPQVRRGLAVYGGLLLLVLAFGNLHWRFSNPQPL
jgi:apolipoprotein N-acyltransferase